MKATAEIFTATERFCSVSQTLDNQYATTLKERPVYFGGVRLLNLWIFSTYLDEHKKPQVVLWENTNPIIPDSLQEQRSNMSCKVPPSEFVFSISPCLCRSILYLHLSLSVFSAIFCHLFSVPVSLCLSPSLSVCLSFLYYSLFFSVFV